MIHEFMLVKLCLIIIIHELYTRDFWFLVCAAITAPYTVSINGACGELFLVMLCRKNDICTSTSFMVFFFSQKLFSGIRPNL